MLAGEYRDLPITLPDFYVFAVGEFAGLFFGRVLICAT